MTLPVSGPMQASMINVELLYDPTAIITLNDTLVRALAVKPTGIISLDDFYGKTNRIIADTTQFATNTSNYIFSPTSVPNYIVGKTDAVLTINSGVYLYSTDTTVAALTISGWSAGDTVTIINNGYIMGKGGDGYTYGVAYSGMRPGGSAISIISSIPIYIQNNSYIAGGGGAGGGNMGGGGAGGGRGSDGLSLNSGGAGGGPGLAGSNGITQGAGTPQQPAAYIRIGTGGGGGRILPGVGGAGSTALNVPGYGGGAGGGAGFYVRPLISVGGGIGGNGGSANNVGGNTSGSGIGSGGGGGWGATGGVGGIIESAPVYGGVGGKAIDLGGSTITLTISGTIYGAVS